MSQVFNVDAMASVIRTITLDGVQHPVNSLSVQDFIDITAEAERIQASGVEKKVSENMHDSAVLAHRYLPSVPVERLLKLTMDQLGAVIKFVRGELDAEAIKSAQGEAGKE